MPDHPRHSNMSGQWSICACGQSSGTQVEDGDEQIQQQMAALSEMADNESVQAPGAIVQQERFSTGGSEIVQQQDRTNQTIYPDSDHVSIVGRHILTDTGAPGKAALFDNCGVYFTFLFVGKDLKVKMDGGGNLFNVVIFTQTDNSRVAFPLETTMGDETYSLTPPASPLDAGVHQVFLIKRTEPSLRTYFSTYGVVTLHEFQINRGHTLPALARPIRRIEFIGDSDTTGYQVRAKPDVHAPECHNQDICCSYAYVAADALNAEAHFVAWSGKGLVRNACHWVQCIFMCDAEVVPQLYERTLSNLPETESNQEQLWDSWQPDVVVVFLGANDYLGKCWAPADATFVDGYMDLIRVIRERRPQASIHCISPAAKIVSGEAPCTSCNNNKETVESFLEDNLKEVLAKCAQLEPPMSNVHIHVVGKKVSDDHLSQQWGGEKHWSVEGQERVGLDLAQHISDVTGWDIDSKKLGLAELIQDSTSPITLPSNMTACSSSLPGRVNAGCNKSSSPDLLF